MAKEYGIRLALENHCDSFSEEILWVLKEVNHTFVGACIDTVNAWHVAEDPMNAIENLAPVAFTNHFRDDCVEFCRDGFKVKGVAVGLTMWVEVARVVRGQVLGIREKEFIQAAKSLGYSSLRILFRHVLPNVITPVIIISAANFASAILMEAGLSFLGIGVQPPIPSWGTMIKDHYGFIIVNKAYLAFLPGVAIMLMVLSFTMVGNGLRDALDVRRK